MRHTLPVCGCASTARGARTRLTATTAASPISRMGTSVGTAAGESSRRSQCAPAPGAHTSSTRLVLALDDAGHYKVGFAGLAKPRPHVPALQQPSDLGADATQQECALFAVGPPDHPRGPRQRLNA